MVKKNKENSAKWNIFLFHVIIFVSVHLLFVQFFELIPLSKLGSVDYKEYIKDNFLNRGVNNYKNSTINSIILLPLFGAVRRLCSCTAKINSII